MTTKKTALAGAESNTQHKEEHIMNNTTLQAFDTATGLLMRHSGGAL
ncbi:hypothetical protein PDESU_01947 [Pontiella desulfatans]|uniref:Uncharacterized protein n=1 Tax=Pontiella desulfatans TaxID=2750659 RepID=A0A6C2U0B2_PONDE|nr:hypothetical protein [Pontiella desulfatans]VGO13390.1 hypothetical protein PDESU_01947 [Pontiella desulfatans]